jgi:membrane peptidoglycan carboxypeptidase
VESGTGTAAQLDRPVAGKTGTTDDFHDAWFVGYVPQLATAAWVGFEQPRPMEGILGVERVTGGSIPAGLWAAYMWTAIEGSEAEGFPDPPPQEVLAVPDVVERDVEEVIESLPEYDFHVLAEAVEDHRPAGTVIEQEPEAGTEVPRGHLLRLQVSDGTGDPPEVPDVVGLDEEEAREALEEAEYEVTVEIEETDVELGPDDDPADLDPPDGAVVEQDPAAGTPLEPGETVTVTVVRYRVEVVQAQVEFTEARPADDPDDEYVVVTNTGDQDVRVDGWSVLVDADVRLEIAAGYLVPPGSSLRVVTGQGTDAPDRDQVGLDEPVLSPDGGDLQLLDADGEEAHRARY